MASTLSYCCWGLAAGFYACSELMTFRKFAIKGDYWSNWNRKYKQPLEKAPSTWYYKVSVLKYKEKFPGSGSVFVSLTDGKHLFQMFFKILICAALVTYEPFWGWLDALLYWILFSIVFSLCYKVFSR